MSTSRDSDVLVDRDRALAELGAIIAEARARQEIAVVRVTGPPGIGKTAFLRSAVTQHGCRPTAWLTAVPSDVAAQGSCVERLAASLGAISGRKNSKAALAGAATFWIDDLQWVDELSLRAIGDAVRSGGDLRLVLAADRRDTTPGLVSHRTIQLNALADRSAARVVLMKYPNAPPPVIEELIRVSAGLPFCLTVLAEQAAHAGIRAPHQAMRSVDSVIAERLSRAEPSAREALQLCSLVDGAADLRVIARALHTTTEGICSLINSFADIASMRQTTVDFRHEILRRAVAASIAEPVGMHRRLLDAYAGFERAVDRSRVILTCAVGCGDSDSAASYALVLGRQAAAVGAAATALHYYETAIRHAVIPLPSVYAVEYANALQYLPRSAEAASFLRAQLRDAIDRGDGDRAADLATSFSSATLTLEREAEFDLMYERIRAMPGFTDGAARRLRTARLVSLAFAGRFEEYHRVAAEGIASPADRRIAAFVAALSGAGSEAQTAFETYQANLRSTQGLQEPADIVMQAAIGLHGIGNVAIADLEDLPAADRLEESYLGVMHLRIAARINDGRWDEARQLAAQQPLWDNGYAEPFAMLDARLQVDALSRRIPAEVPRTLRTIHAMIGRGQVRHAVSPARWYAVATDRSGAPDDKQINAFVAETLAVEPIPYLVTASPLAIPFLASRFGAAACREGFERWPRFGSRWRVANDRIARGLIESDREMLREARDEFDRLGSPAMAMIAGLGLPVPRAIDVAMAHALGFSSHPQAAQRPSLTPRENELVELAAQGLPNREIATRIGISERTVEVHLGNAFRKLGVRSRSGLAQYVFARDRSHAQPPTRSPRKAAPTQD